MSPADTAILVPDGFTIDGAGNTITAVDPPLSNFKGADNERNQCNIGKGGGGFNPSRNGRHGGRGAQAETVLFAAAS